MKGFVQSSSRDRGQCDKGVCDTAGLSSVLTHCCYTSLPDAGMATAAVHGSRAPASVAVLPLRTPCRFSRKPRRPSKHTLAATTEQAPQAYNPGRCVVFTCRGFQPLLKVPAELEWYCRFDETAEDYYSILGVPASAPVSQIKQTYYKTIRDCHPDITGEADDQATEFCIFLNEIYEVCLGHFGAVAPSYWCSYWHSIPPPPPGLSATRGGCRLSVIQ